MVNHYMVWNLHQCVVQHCKVQKCIILFRMVQNYELWNFTPTCCITLYITPICYMELTSMCSTGICSVVQPCMVYDCRVEYVCGRAPTLQLSPFPFHPGQSKGEVCNPSCRGNKIPLCCIWFEEVKGRVKKKDGKLSTFCG